MFRLSNLSRRRFVQEQLCRKRLLSTPAAKKPTTETVKSVGSASKNDKNQPSSVVVVGVSMLAMGSIVLILNANNETLIEQSEKHAPIVNKILAPFRAPPTLPVPKPKTVEINTTNKSTYDTLSKPAGTEKQKKLPVVQSELAKITEESTPTEPEPTVETTEPIVETPKPIAESDSSPVTATEMVDSDESEVNEELYEQIHKVINPNEAESEATALPTTTVIPEGEDKVAWLLSLGAKDDRFYDGLKELNAEEREYFWTESTARAVAHDAPPTPPTEHTATAPVSNAHHDLLSHELQVQARTILSELQNELHRTHVRDLEVQYARDLQDALKAQSIELEDRKRDELQRMEARIVGEMTAEANNKLAHLHKQAVDEFMSLHPVVEDLKAQVRAFDAVAEQTAQAVRATLDAHKISSAVLALELALSEYGPSNSIQPSLAVLRSACQDDPLVLSVVESLPARVLRDGALNSSQLQVRFNVMRNEVRKVALAPEEAPKMIGAAIGHILAKLTWVPKGFLTGQGVEDALARADYFLERGRVKEALDELEAVTGYSSVLMRDFKTLANDRLVVDQSISILKAKSIVRHKSFA